MYRKKFQIKYIFLVICIHTLTVVSSACATRGPPNVTLIDDAVFDRGTWANWEFCLYKMKTTAFRLKYQGKTTDNTAINSIELECEDGKKILSAEDNDGGWKSAEKCPKGTHITGFRVRSYLCSCSDEIGITDFDMKCNDTTTVLSGSTGFSTTNTTLGDWMECPRYYYICGIRAKIDPCSSTSTCDRVGVTRVSFMCCEPPKPWS